MNSHLHFKSQYPPWVGLLCGLCDLQGLGLSFYPRGLARESLVAYVFIRLGFWPRDLVWRFGFPRTDVGRGKSGFLDIFTASMTYVM